MGYSVLGTTAARFMGMDHGVFLHREIGQVCYRLLQSEKNTGKSFQQYSKKREKKKKIAKECL